MYLLFEDEHQDYDETLFSHSDNDLVDILNI